MPIRRFEPHDQSKVLELAAKLERSAASRKVAGQAWTTPTVREWLCDHEVWVATEGPGLTGILILRQVDEKTQEILIVATDVDHQRTGIGRQILTETWFSHPEIQEWWLEVHERNLDAIGLYTKLGFKKVGQRPKYYADQGSALLFTLLRA